MGVFSRAFWGATTGRIVVVVILAIFGAFGIGVDFWVRTVINWWGANPTDATIALLRFAATVIGIVCLLAIALPILWLALRPRKFSVSFNSARDVHAAIPQFDLRTGQQVPNRTTFVHVHVESVRGYVTTCTGAITSLEKLDDKNKVINRIAGTRQLLWAPREQGLVQKTIAPHLPQDLDLFRTEEGVNRLEVLSIGHPPSWIGFFGSPGRYRITVGVHGGNRTETILVVVNWRGRWDNFDATAKL
jgi:hypothetical protein